MTGMQNLKNSLEHDKYEEENEMFKKFMSFALALIMVVGLVACGGGSTSTPSTPSTGTTTPGTSTPSDPSKPVKDTVNIALEAAVASSDPMGNTKNATMQTFQWVYESLVYADGDANIHPALATS